MSTWRRHPIIYQINTYEEMRAAGLYVDLGRNCRVFQLRAV
jgi:hypothetical protein